MCSMTGAVENFSTLGISNRVVARDNVWMPFKRTASLSYPCIDNRKTNAVACKTRYEAVC